jgi:hypothetical protein
MEREFLIAAKVIIEESRHKEKYHEHIQSPESGLNIDDYLGSVGQQE